MEQQDEEQDEEVPMELNENFDIKKFRQNLKAGNFYDGECAQIKQNRNVSH
jgi:hypothetical protein